jgi:hypothetical protein
MTKITTLGNGDAPSAVRPSKMLMHVATNVILYFTFVTDAAQTELDFRTQSRKGIECEVNHNHGRRIIGRIGVTASREDKTIHRMLAAQGIAIGKEINRTSAQGNLVPGLRIILPFLC